MASRFFFGYSGCKRLEVKQLDKVVNWSAYSTVVEPFCGSAAVSLDLHARGLGHRFHLNDTDEELIGLLQHVKTEGSEGLYEYARDRLTVDEWVRHQGLRRQSRVLPPAEYFYWRRVRANFGRTSREPEKWPSLIRGPKIQETDACLADPATTITLGDWRECMRTHKDDPEALIYLDPPYFWAASGEYYETELAVGADGLVTDGTALWLEVLGYLQTARARVIVTTNSVAILDHLFAPYIVARYPKTYGGAIMRGQGYVKRHAFHVILDSQAPAAQKGERQPLTAASSPGPA